MSVLFKIVIGIVVIIAVLGVYASKIESVEGPKRKRKIDHLISLHIRELSIKAQQLVVDKGYGIKNADKWEKEKLHFINNIVVPVIGTNFAHLHSTISKDIDDAVHRYRANMLQTGYHDDMGPYEYEHFCARLLKQAGWDANATVASGDQGADVIATKSGRRIILQCKKWTASVGNKAVQEVHTAKSFHRADKGVVVTNSSYTLSARQAASAVGVLLLHHDDLLFIDELL